MVGGLNTTVRNDAGASLDTLASGNEQATCSNHCVVCLSHFCLQRLPKPLGKLRCSSIPCVTFRVAYEQTQCSNSNTKSLEQH